MAWKSKIYEGTVRHRRFAPVAHDFDVPLFMLYLDLGELPRLFRRTGLWSASRPNVAWFRRSDYLGNPEVDLATAVRSAVQDETGHRPTGPVRVLTHLRYLGYAFNPVSFYYVFDEDDTRPEFVVAEITNTPWGERHAYVLDMRGAGGDFRQRHDFDKEFHVSPFMGMDVRYRWHLTQPAERLAVHIQNRREGELIFDATLDLRRRELSGRRLNGLLARYPILTLGVMTRIHLEALKLWLKGAPFYPHPRKRTKRRQAA